MEDMMKEVLPSLEGATPEELAHAIFDVLDEMALCKIDRREFDLIEFHVDMTAAKVDLESSPIMKQLRAQCERS
jgi:hypothetical protein